MEKMDEGKARPDIRVALRISGGVQGVYYRRDAHREAQRLGLSGFVRNEPDGSVYAEAEGQPDRVGSFIHWCRKGPPNALVDAVETRECALQGKEGFEIRYG